MTGGRRRPCSPRCARSRISSPRRSTTTTGSSSPAAGTCRRRRRAAARSWPPTTFDLPGYDISAVMMPAEEVGGDFYEFRRTGGGAWLGIGDVTGHGVTSGLIMMMAQSMFTLLCEQQDGHVTPAQFLSLLNRA